MRKAPLVAFGRNARTRREERDFTQEALAERADLDRAWIGDAGRGARNASMPGTVRIARALGTTASALTRGVGG
jgi:transcriptional regulator with XRE-family HTH domain